MNLDFPQISRFFSAPAVTTVGKLTLWSLMAVLVGFNTFTLINYPPAHINERMAILRQPMDWSAHVALGTKLWSEGDQAEAKNELAIAQELFQKGSQVLGVSTTPSDILEMWRQEPVRELSRLQFWQRVVSDRPDYRDGFIQLAHVSYASGHPAEAAAAIRRAQELDPNYPLSNEIARFLKK